ncbi:MAG: hypothetical protein KGJ62_07480 [Armatimonadetes bacterium]|nr:hypothetical protein [Armatimonadota bacterium]MDE2207470.1 hypothetical protein [Armatimonadota bacterium]
MRRLTLLRELAMAALLCLPAASSLAQAGTAPFTIRMPPDGSTVRETVNVEIPRASIPENGFVAFFIDGVFDVALSPQKGAPADSPFLYQWDTKALKVSDGPHTLRAVLYAPVDSSLGAAQVTQKASSEVNVTVANRIHQDLGRVLLRYKLHSGQNLRYTRGGRTYIVGGVTEQAVSTSDQDLARMTGSLLLNVEDANSTSSLVRNKLTSLTVTVNGQEYTLPSSDLSDSMYQEVNPRGLVQYETGASTGTQQFESQGLAVDNSIELPLLPAQAVQQGDVWYTPKQRIAIPGVPPDQQPKEDVKNTFEDVEWQNNYPTIRIRQEYSGHAGKLPIQVGPVLVSFPRVKYQRDIYVAWHSGTLIRTDQTLTISGRTTQVIGQSAPGAGGAGAAGGMGKFGGGLGMMGGAPGPGGFGGVPGPGGFSGLPGKSGGAFPGGFGGGGFPGVPGKGGGAFPGGFGGGRAGGGAFPGGFGGGRQGGGAFPGGFGGGGFPGVPGKGGGAFPGGFGGAQGGPGAFGGRPGMGGAFPGGAGGGFGITPPTGGIGSAPEHPVVIRAVTDTRLKSTH